ncbi:MAG: B12-binding domain-containing radical SAM protein [Polyangiales bacterium]
MDTRRRISLPLHPLPSPQRATEHRRVVLVDFHWTRDKDPRVPLGHASLLAALTAQLTLDVRSLVIPVNRPGSDASSVVRSILAATRDSAPSTVDVAFGAYVWGESLLRDVLRRLRSAGFRGRIIVGGPQVSYASEGLEQLYPEADAFIRGYGEHALTELASTAERRDIPGVHLRGELDRGAQAKVDLESLPSPWLGSIVNVPASGFVRWETQRGCPFRCAFCQHREAGARLPRRTLSRTRIQEEIDMFCDLGVTDIAVLDPIFNLGPHAVEVLERFATRGFRGRLSLQCRAEGMRPEFLDAAAQLNVCLEFGLQTIHEDEGRAVDRRNDIARVDRTLAAVRERGIAHEVSLIFGLPHQTLASFQESVDWCLERRVPVLKAFPLLLLRGTALERDRARWGLCATDGEMPLVTHSNTFTHEDWRQMARLSDALRLTEGNHPTTIEALVARSAGLEPDLFRWLPDANEVAA